jgi:hypothetical protein
MTAPTATTWQSRITGSGVEKASTLRANPLNYRRHPAHQHAALRDMLNEVGWVQNVIVNTRTGHVVDGHLRVELAMTQGDEDVPVLYVDLEEREERLVLAAMDPIAALAESDGGVLAQLLDGLQFDGDALAGMLTDLTALTAPPAEAPPRGDALDELDVLIAEPAHETHHGDTWKLGPHVLYVGSVHRDWPAWSPHLVAGAVFAPYPTPMLAVLYQEGPLVMVQPDTYLAGHVVDKWVSRHGQASKL